MNILRSFVANLGMRQKLLLLLMLPMLATLVFSYNLMVDKQGESQRLNEVAIGNELIVSIGNLTHELQKERGMSAGFVGSRGVKFADKLPVQRQHTDKMLALFEQNIDALAGQYGALKLIKPLIEEARMNLNQLAGKRSGVSGLSLSVPETVAFYSGINASLFDIFPVMIRFNYFPEYAVGADLTMMQTALFNFLLQKERAGIERAVLAGAFSADAFAPGMYVKAVQLITEQRAFNKSFLAIGEDEHTDAYRNMLSNPAFQDVERMRKVALARGLEGGFGIDSSVWFKTISAKINLLKQMEEELEKDLIEESIMFSEHAMTDLTYISIACALVLFLSLLFAWLITTGVATAMREALRIAEAVADGDLDCASTLPSSADEVGKLMKALEIMRHRLSGTLNDEIAPVLDAAKRGDLTANISTEGKQGFYLQLANTTNDMIDQVQQAIEDTVTSLTALEHGDLSQRITTEYEGDFDVIKQAANNTAEKLNAILAEEIGPVLDAAKRGDLTQNIGIEGKEGFFLQLTKAINELIDQVQGAIEDTVSGLTALESGNLSHRISTDYEGDYDVIKQAANNTSEKLMNVIGGVDSAAAEVATGSAEIASGNAKLNESTQQQAASLEETAASIEEITGTIQQTADNSRQANQLAADARKQAENGNAVVDQAAKAMSGISQSSKKIADIIGVIDEIAFQTNLLALNAAVEAARAGEQGRGFAVVAGEVRSLAQRSAEAAKEIKTLINESVASVEEGGKLVDESGEALSEIVNSVSKVSDIIAEIAAASGEQASGVEQINKAIAQLDSGTQQNAAMVEEVSAASENLDGQVRTLRDLVSVFDLGAGQQKPASAKVKKLASVSKNAATVTAMKSVSTLKKSPRPKTDEVWEEF